MLPCLEGEGCELLANRSGWTCTRHGGRRKTTTVRARPPAPAARGTGRPPVPSSSPALTAPAGPLSLSPTALSLPDGHRVCSGPSGRQNRARGRQRRAQVAGGSVWCLGDGWLEPRGSFGWGVGGSEPSPPRPRCMWLFAAGIPRGHGPPLQGMGVGPLPSLRARVSAGRGSQPLGSGAGGSPTLPLPLRELRWAVATEVRRPGGLVQGTPGGLEQMAGGGEA